MKPSSFLHYDKTTHTVSNAQGETKVLSPQCAILLAMMLEAPRHIVTREQMRQTIWLHNNVVSEDLINHLVYRLKKELSCLTAIPTWHIEVIPKTGYRLIVEPAPSRSWGPWFQRFRHWYQRCRPWFQSCRRWLQRWRLKP